MDLLISSILLDNIAHFGYRCVDGKKYLCGCYICCASAFFVGKTTRSQPTLNYFGRIVSRSSEDDRITVGKIDADRHGSAADDDVDFRHSRVAKTVKYLFSRGPFCLCAEKIHVESFWKHPSRVFHVVDGEELLPAFIIDPIDIKKDTFTSLVLDKL